MAWRNAVRKHDTKRNSGPDSILPDQTTPSSSNEEPNSLQKDSVALYRKYASKRNAANAVASDGKPHAKPAASLKDSNVTAKEKTHAANTKSKTVVKQSTGLSFRPISDTRKPHTRSIAKSPADTRRKASSNGEKIKPLLQSQNSQKSSRLITKQEWPSMSPSVSNNTKPPLTYSSMLKKNVGSQPQPINKSNLPVSALDLSSPEVDKMDAKRRKLKEKKKMKKKRKQDERRANRESVEVSPGNPEPIVFNIANILDSYLKNSKREDNHRNGRMTAQKKPVKQVLTAGILPRAASNAKTSSARRQPEITSKPVTLKRGKVRESPKKKRLTMLRQVILAARKRKKELLESQRDTITVPKTQLEQHPTSVNDQETEALALIQNDASDNAVKPKVTDELPRDEAELQIENARDVTPADESGNGQPEQDSTTTVAGSTKMTEQVIVSSEEQTTKSAIELTDCDSLTELPPVLCSRMHSRKFREYCDHLIDKDIDEVATLLLSELLRFQDRVYHENPTKFQQKKRMIQGLREVRRSLKVNKLKCVILAPNLERVAVQGGIDDYIGQIIVSCHRSGLPIIYTMTRQKLGKILRKKVPVSVIGIISYDGAQNHFKKLIELTEDAKMRYREKLLSICKEEGIDPPSRFAESLADETTPTGDSSYTGTEHEATKPEADIKARMLANLT